MRKSLRLATPLAASALALAMTPGTAFADSEHNYSATLNELNGSGGSGMFSMTVHEGQATVDLSWSGLAPAFQGGPYPHVQHIHIGGRGECPTPSEDQNGDGIVDTPEGQPAYGGIGTTLSVKGDTSANAGTNIKIAPGGGSTEYHRTFQLNQDTLNALQSGSGVVVVHGLNPADLSKKAANAKSSLAPQLPLAATAPALCGALGSMPAGGVETGAGSTSGIENAGLLGAGGGLLAAAGAFLGLRRRTARQGS
jgi:hypothetical protein